jgi:hypothetical protein
LLVAVAVAVVVVDVGDEAAAVVAVVGCDGNAGVLFCDRMDGALDEDEYAKDDDDGGGDDEVTL